VTRRDLSDGALLAALFALGIAIDVVLAIVGLEVLELLGFWPTERLERLRPAS
jgi:hypothetical protein